MRNRLAVVALATMAILVAATTTASATSYPPLCKARQLRGRVAGSSGAAGTIVLSLALTNRGSTCSTKGYTGLRLMAGARRPLPTHVLHGGLAILNQRPRLVVLTHGGVATVLVAYSDVPTGGQHSCPAASEILVRVPGDTTWLGVLAHIRACNHGTLRESPILAGRRRAP